MYLTALITKWRNKDIQFVVDFPRPDCFEVTAHSLKYGRYHNAKAQSLEQCCKMLDCALSMFTEKISDNHNTNTGEK